MQSLRLQQLVKYIPDGEGVADIGTDHAQIPIYLARHSNCRPIIAGEVSTGPYLTAQHWIREAGLEDVIDLRLGSGLTILKPGEVNWAVIAGMGFKSIIEIISETETVARSVKGLILQPMQGSDELRRWLVGNFFQIKDEVLIKEDDKLFQIMLVTSGESHGLEDIFYDIGPVLYEKGDPYLAEHIQSLITYHREVLDKISSTESMELNIKANKLNAKIHRLKEVLEQWQKKFNG